MNAMSEPLDTLVGELVRANRILANEGVLDAFGHVSVRDPAKPETFLLSRSRSPQLVEAADIRSFGLDSQPLRPDGRANYAERVIHGAAYRERADVGAVCHFHAPAIMPFAIAGTVIRPVVHVGALIGHEVPLWDMRDEFGNTDMLVSTEAQGRSLARAIGNGWAVLIRRHGAVVVARSLRELVFRSIVLTVNAEMQLRASTLGDPSALTAEEVALSSEANLRDSVQERVWDYWSSRLPQPAAAAGH